MIVRRRSTLLSTLVIVCGCTGGDHGEATRSCDGDTQARELAGEGAIDCGVVPVSGDPSAVDACVLDAFRRGQPLVARYEQPSIDSESAIFLAFRDGTVTELFWDTYGSCRGCPFVTAESCDNPEEADPPMTSPDAGAEPTRILPLSCTTEPSSQRLCG